MNWPGRTTRKAFALFLVFEGSAGLGCTDSERKQTGSERQQPPSLGTVETPITAEQILETRKHGSRAVEERFVGMWLTVRGEVIGVGQRELDVSGIKGDLNKLPIIMCRSKKVDESNFEACFLGDVVTIRGLCYRVSNEEYVLLRECEVLQWTPKDQLKRTK
jgi:hypothetical protein